MADTSLLVAMRGCYKEKRKNTTRMLKHKFQSYFGQFEETECKQAIRNWWKIFGIMPKGIEVLEETLARPVRSVTAEPRGLVGAGPGAVFGCFSFWQHVLEWLT